MSTCVNHRRSLLLFVIYLIAAAVWSISYVLSGRELQWEKTGVDRTISLNDGAVDYEVRWQTRPLPGIHANGGYTVSSTARKLYEWDWMIVHFLKWGVITSPDDGFIYGYVKTLSFRMGWLLLFSSPLVFGSLIVASRRRQKLQKESGICAKCGFDLRATPHRCPECGTIPSKDVKQRTSNGDVAALSHPSSNHDKRIIRS